MGKPPLPQERTSIATYSDYESAQRAVDSLADQRFPVENVQIVGSDLRMVEQVTGRLTWWRTALAGLGTGVWIGLLVALLIWALVPAISLPGALLPGLLWGALFGLVFGLVSYALTAGRRDFSSRSALLPARYDVLVSTVHADRAREMLGLGGASGEVHPA